MSWPRTNGTMKSSVCSSNSGGLGECGGDYRHRRHAPLLRFYPVVETPRCPGTSIGHEMDDRLALRRQIVQHLRRSRDTLAVLPVVNHLVHAELVFEKLSGLRQVEVRAALMVVDQADPSSLAVRRGVAQTSGPQQHPRLPGSTQWSSSCWSWLTLTISSSYLLAVS